MLAGTNTNNNNIFANIGALTWCVCTIEYSGSNCCLHLVQHAFAFVLLLNLSNQVVLKWIQMFYHQEYCHQPTFNHAVNGYMTSFHPWLGRGLMRPVTMLSAPYNIQVYQQQANPGLSCSVNVM